MDISHLVKMANDIGAYFAAYPDRAQAELEVANHLTRFWDPRMRAQLIAHVRDRDGEGLTDITLASVRQMDDVVSQNNHHRDNP